MTAIQPVSYNTSYQPRQKQSVMDQVNSIDHNLLLALTAAGNESFSSRFAKSFKSKASRRALEVLSGVNVKSMPKPHLNAFDQFALKINTIARHTTYDHLAGHIVQYGSIKKFDWKSLFKGRAASHLDPFTKMISDPNRASWGRFATATIGKGLLFYDVIKDSKISYQNARCEGDGKVKSFLKSLGTGIKELGKGLFIWEAAAAGAAAGTALLPGLGTVAGFFGGLITGIFAGYGAEFVLPSPKKKVLPHAHQKQQVNYLA